MIAVRQPMVFGRESDFLACTNGTFIRADHSI